MTTLLFAFSNELDFNNFRVPEFWSLCKLFNVQNVVLDQPTDRFPPFIIVRGMSEEDAIKIASREIMLKHVFELWAQAPTFLQAFEQLEKLDDLEFEQKIGKFVNSSQIPDKCSDSNKLSCESENNGQQSALCRLQIIYDVYGSRSLNTDNEKDEQLYKPLIRCLRGRPIIIDLKNPTLKVFIIEDKYSDEFARLQKEGKSKDLNIKNSVSTIIDYNIPHIFIGRHICDGPRYLLKDFNLKTRPYIGTTSMREQLSFICANQGLVRKGSLINDPYCGTMSIGLSCCQFGGYIIGSDFDIRCIRGQADRNIRTNFDKHHLPHPELIIADQSHSPYNIFNSKDKLNKELFDGIICDPPYGF
ncbi:MAG: putative tRNA guanosine-2'-O-methyltransferase [Streblomastix strix]|uniref:Putative tRNA guanosine-2'-O-methyltransferase n=1 Tax=Streblomastix strix TaxID=222440 RepID=A0A5J4W4R2_9EUKA|nr:MAG: putative tRNA guanosine-2'-O-methyltransferase [Streblomastix strix]